MPAEEAREDGDPRAGIRDPRESKSRSQVPDPRAGDAEAQAGRHAEPAQSHLYEAGRGRDRLPAVRRARSASRLPGELCAAAAAAATTAGAEPAAELRHRVSGEGRGVRGRFLSAEQSLRAHDVGRRLHGLAEL